MGTVLWILLVALVITLGVLIAAGLVFAGCVLLWIAFHDGEVAESLDA